MLTLFTQTCRTCGKQVTVPWKQRVCSQCTIPLVEISPDDRERLALAGSPVSTIRTLRFADFYVYRWFIVGWDEPFYIGKGSPRYGRATAFHEAVPKTKRPAFCQIIRDHYAPLGLFTWEVYRYELTDADAYALEHLLVNDAVAAGHQLANRCVGGTRKWKHRKQLDRT